MKKLILAAFSVALLVSLPRQANAQKEKMSTDKMKMQTNKTGISAEDKKALVELFKGVDPKMYRLEFNNAKEVYGSKKVTMGEVQQANKVRNPGGANGYMVLITRDNGALF